jgi:hypothetical protein
MRWFVNVEPKVVHWIYLVLQVPPGILKLPTGWIKAAESACAAWRTAGLISQIFQHNTFRILLKLPKHQPELFFIIITKHRIATHPIFPCHGTLTL